MDLSACIASCVWRRSCGVRAPFSRSSSALKSAATHQPLSSTIHHTPTHQVLGVPADGASAVRKAVQPIIDWLHEAESDDSDSDDDDAEEEEEGGSDE